MKPQQDNIATTALASPFAQANKLTQMLYLAIE
jgi:hypothetical protein